MEKEPLSTLIHYDYFYENTDIDTIKKGINEAVHEKNYTAQYVYEAVIKNASRHNRIDILEFMFSKEDLGLKQKTLNEILNFTFMIRQFESSEFLIKKGGELNFNDPSITNVLPYCSLELLHIIKEHGHNIYDPKYKLLFSSFQEYPARYDIIEDILQNGSTFEDIRYDHLYYIFLSFDHEESNKKIDYVISKGFDVTKEDCALVKWTVGKGYSIVLKHLISLGVDLYPKEGSLFIYAARNDDGKIFDLLIEHGLVLDNKDDSIIKIAAECDNLNTIKYLVSKGFDVEVAGQFGFDKVKKWYTEEFVNQLDTSLNINEASQKKNKL